MYVLFATYLNICQPIQTICIHNLTAYQIYISTDWLAIEEECVNYFASLFCFLETD